MTTVIEDFVAKLGWDIDNSKLVAFNRSISGLDKGLSSVSTRMVRGLKTGFKYATAGAVALGGGIALVAREYSKIEDAQAAFQPLLGSVGRANELVNELNQTAATTPFQFEQLAGVSQTLLPVMEGNIGKTVETLRMLGDTAGGNAQKFQGIAYGYTKAFLKGKVDMESLNMIGERGVPIIAELGKMYGKTTKQVLEMSSKGKISTDDLTAAFKRMTEKGGIFFNGMSIASGTLSGKLSTLKDNAGLAAAEFGKVLSPYLKALTDRLIATAIHIREWVHANRALIRTKITEYIKKIPEIIEKIAYWVPKIAKLVGVFLAITASVKALNVAMKAVILTKALLGKTGPLMKLSNYLGGTLPTEAGKASKALKGVSFAAGAIAAAFIGWEIGTIIHDEIIDPIMKATHEIEMLLKRVSGTMKKDTSKMTEGQITTAQRELEQMQAVFRGEGKSAQAIAFSLPDFMMGGGLFQQMGNVALAKERGRLSRAKAGAHQRGNVARFSGYQEVSDYVNDWSGQSRMGTVDQSTKVSKVENHVHVAGTSASPEDIERSSKKGIESAFKKMKRNNE